MEEEGPIGNGTPVGQQGTIIPIRRAYESSRSHLAAAMDHDPVHFVHRFGDQADREIAAFLSAQFAYGKIDLFHRFLETIFVILGDNPADAIRSGRFGPAGRLYYRFQNGEEILRLFGGLRSILRDYGTFGTMFRSLYAGDGREAIWKIRQVLRLSGKELTFFFPEPSPSNPMKRWNLFLRWMVRKDEIDLGLWDFIAPEDLIVPLDTHVFKIGRCLGWTKRQAPTWRAAVDITENLKRYDHRDPLKYDFYLCHFIGIGARCTGTRTEDCSHSCPLVQMARSAGDDSAFR